MIELIFGDHAQLEPFRCQDLHVLFLEFPVQVNYKVIQVQVVLQENIVFYIFEIAGFYRAGRDRYAIDIPGNKLHDFAAHMEVTEY